MQHHQQCNFKLIVLCGYQYVFCQMFDIISCLFFILELSYFFQNFSYFIEVVTYVLIFASILSHSNIIWANLRQILWIKNYYYLINILNTSFCIYFKVPTWSNGQEFVEKRFVTWCTIFCDAMCDILSLVTGTASDMTSATSELCLTKGWRSEKSETRCWFDGYWDRCMGSHWYHRDWISYMGICRISYKDVVILAERKAILRFYFITWIINIGSMNL